MNFDKPTVVMMCGIPASGKSSYAQNLVNNHGFVRLNRDSIGGKVDALIPLMLAALDKGDSVLLDNTHINVAARTKFITALNGRVPIHAVWFDVTTSDCQFNACKRMMEREGRLLEVKEMENHPSPNIFPPHVIFRFAKQFEPPTVAEGFQTVERVKNLTWCDGVRKYPASYTGKALLLDYDGTLRRSRGEFQWPVSCKDIEILPGRTPILQAWQDAGFHLLGVSNQSPISKGQFSIADANEMFAHTNKLLGLDIEVKFCPHRSNPIECYCRKPGPGIGVYFIEKFHLNPQLCLMVGDKTSDQTFATRCGFKYVAADMFFKAGTSDRKMNEILEGS